MMMMIDQSLLFFSAQTVIPIFYILIRFRDICGQIWSCPKSRQIYHGFALL